MKYIFAALIFVLGSSAFGSSNLSFTVVPTQPILIPLGNTTVNGVAVTAPYFITNALNVTWKGTGNLEIVSILFESHDTTQGSVECGIAGDDLTAAFPNQIANNNVMLASAASATSSQIACSNVAVMQPVPSVLNIPVTVTVVGVALDDNGNAISRETATAEIVVQ